MLLESIGLVADLHGYTPGQVSVRSSPSAHLLTEYCRQTGLVFLSICLGAVIGQATNPIQSILYARYVAKIGPEARLYSACVAAVMFPIGCFICECKKAASSAFLD